MWENAQIVWGTLAVVLLDFLSPRADLTPTLRCWSDDLALAAVLPSFSCPSLELSVQPAAGAGSRPAYPLSPRAFLVISKTKSGDLTVSRKSCCVVSVGKPGSILVMVTESASALDNTD